MESPEIRKGITISGVITARDQITAMISVGDCMENQKIGRILAIVKGIPEFFKQPDMIPKTTGDSNFNFSLSKEQMEQFYKLLNHSQNQSTAHGQQTQQTTSVSLLAQKGTFLTALSGTSEKLEPWVIYSRATDHMTGCASFFRTYKLSPRNLKVKIADGSLATVAGIGNIDISPQISLKDVLHVPKLSCNLLCFYGPFSG